MITYFLIEYEGKLFIEMQARLEKIPPMDIGILETWIDGQHGQTLLPHGGQNVRIVTNGRQLPLERLEGAKVLERYVVGNTLIPFPPWLDEFRERTDENVSKCLFMGDPNIYSHTVPIKRKEQPFVSVDPLTHPCFYDEHLVKRVLVTGCFDIFHVGHFYFLYEVYQKYVENQNRELHIGLANDLGYTCLKGRKPFFSFTERKTFLESLQFVAKVHELDVWKDAPVGTQGVEDGHRDLIKAVDPILFVDSRQKPKERIGALPYLEEAKVPIDYVDSIDIHSTEIIDRIQGR